MRRRSLLASVGGLLAAGAAGCLSDGSPGGGTTTDDTTDGTTPGDGTTTPGDGTTTPGDGTTTPGDGTTTPGDDPGGSTDWGPDTPEPFETLTVGSRDGVAFPENHKPHVVRVWNGASEARTVALILTVGGTTVLDREFEFPADGWVRMTLNDPAAYDLAVALGGERAGTVALDAGLFDCNDSVTNVAIDAEGAVDSTTISTEIACPGPEIAGRSFSTGEGDCGTRDEASATFEGGAVTVDGAVKTPTPCYDLELSAARLVESEQYDDGSDDVLEVVVSSTGPKKEICVECVGSVPYEATVEFDNEYPSNVRVVHESMSDRRTVLETGR